MIRLVIITALMAEAVPLIEHYKMQKQPKQAGFHLYRGEQIELIVCGLGRDKTLHGIKAYLAQSNVDSRPSWLNIGIAGALSQPVGSLIWAHSIAGKTISIPNNCARQPGMDVISLSKPSTAYRANILFDMEAAFCLKALEDNLDQFKPESDLFCAKVISDNLSEHCHDITKQAVTLLLRKNIMTLRNEIENIIKSIR